MRSFIWKDGERMIHFGRGKAAEAVDALGGPGYTLLTTERAASAAPWIAMAASAVHQVPPGHVDHIAAELRGTVKGDRLVALGGGRVIDVTKALVAADGGTAMAIPTTLSGAEMTQGHRHARGVDESTPRVRPAVVVFDPELAASQPVPEMAASSLNALGHAIEGVCTVRANPVATLAAHEAARLLEAGWAGREPDRDALALGAMLAGYVIDSTGLGLHHVLAQTLVRYAGIGHGPANAAMLPQTIGALAWRFPDRIAAFGDPAALALSIRARTGAGGLADLGVDRAVLPKCADAAAARPQLENTPPAADRAEILALYESAL
ncbi:MAG TPA: iron-containing alcohol dehydrogenase [Solirubrobacter sp.]|nr:iron-containing alcohol dehydrogenase [Solirubrobacter sp.]